jgi:hypothetical protein
LPARSPRAVGETAYYGGKLAGGINALPQRLGLSTIGNLPARSIGQAAYQAGRLPTNPYSLP